MVNNLDGFNAIALTVKSPLVNKMRKPEHLPFIEINL